MFFITTINFAIANDIEDNLREDKLILAFTMALATIVE